MHQNHNIQYIQEVDLLDKIRQFPKRYVIIAIVILLTLLIYFVGAFYFNSHFLPSTYAGPVEVSQMTSQRAAEAVEEDIEASTLIFNENENNIGYIELNQLDISAEVNELMSQSLDNQNGWIWPFAFFTGEKIVNIQDQIQINEDIVAGLVPSLGINNDDRDPTVDAMLVKSSDGTINISQEEYGNQVTKETLTQAIIQTIGKGSGQLNIEEAYVKPKELTESDSLIQRADTIETMKGTSITLEIDGNSVKIPQDQIVSWIYLDEENNPQVDQEAVEEYILSLNEQYAGLFLPRWFNSTYQGEVQVQPGTYGWFIDRYDEAALIVEDIHNGAQVTREPVIGGSGYGMGDYIGENYVEVDIAYQMMFIYRDGQLVLDTPIVSGIIGAETVPGAYQVWNMERDTDLVGYNTITEQDYVQPVSYWIAFDDQAQGIHDAGWQSSFGGNAYQTAGSLGCINTPPGMMGQVFELVEYGMPVIVF